MKIKNFKGIEYSPKTARVLNIINELRKITPPNQLIRIGENITDPELSLSDLVLIIEKLHISECYMMAIESYEIIGGQRVEGWDIVISDDNKFNDFVDNYLALENINDEKGQLEFSANGQIHYKSPSGHIYTAKLKRNTNSYLLLKYMIEHFNESLNAPNLEKVLKKVRNNNNEEGGTPDRRVRDTIQSIRNKLGINKIKQDDLFNMQGNGLFGIRCAVKYSQ